MERRLASGMPWDAETSRLLDQTPSNPARSTSFAPRPLWAPTIRTRPGRGNSSLNFFALDIPLSHEGVIQEREKGWSGPVSRILSSPRGEGWSFLWVPHCCRTLAAYPRAPGALLPHHFPLPPRAALNKKESKGCRRGGIFSVALSLGLPPVGVTHHPALWSPDFPPRSCDRSDHPAHSSQEQI